MPCLYKFILLVVPLLFFLKTVYCVLNHPSHPEFLQSMIWQKILPKAFSPRDPLRGLGRGSSAKGIPTEEIVTKSTILTISGQSPSLKVSQSPTLTHSEICSFVAFHPDEMKKISWGKRGRLSLPSFHYFTLVAVNGIWYSGGPRVPVNSSSLNSPDISMR